MSSITRHVSPWLIPVLALGLSPVYAEALETLTLRQALSLAKEHNTRVIKARQSIEAAKARLSTAKAYPNPEIGYETYRSGEGQSDHELSVSQEIELSGRRRARRATAETDVALAGAELELIRSDVALEVKEAYYDLLLTDKTRTIARENLSLFRRLLDSVQMKYNSGTVMLSEVLRAKIELSRAENEVSLADKEYRAARAKLSLLLNKPVDLEFAAADPLEFDQKELDHAGLTREAYAANPALKALALTAQRSRQGIVFEKKNVLANPRIGYVEKSEGGSRFRGVSLGIGLPLWDRNSGAIDEAGVSADRAGQDVAYMKKQLEASLYDAGIEAEAAAKQAMNYRRSVEQASEIQNQIDLQFKEGKVDFLAYLDGLKTVKDVKLGYFAAVANYNKKIALIEKLVGKE